MDTLYLAYLALLDDLSRVLEQLSDLDRQKVTAVRSDDLMALDQILKQEQALSLNLRGLEQKMITQREQLSLPQNSVSQLVESYPPHLQMQAKQAVERLRTQYDIYHSAAEVARNTLECNLHEIEKIVSSLGGNNNQGVGYATPDAEPPRKMKTDFRA